MKKIAPFIVTSVLTVSLSLPFAVYAQTRAQSPAFTPSILLESGSAFDYDAAAIAGASDTEDGSSEDTGEGQAEDPYSENGDTQENPPSDGGGVDEGQPSDEDGAQPTDEGSTDEGQPSDVDGADDEQPADEGSSGDGQPTDEGSSDDDQQSDDGQQSDEGNSNEGSTNDGQSTDEGSQDDSNQSDDDNRKTSDDGSRDEDKLSDEIVEDGENDPSSEKTDSSDDKDKQSDFSEDKDSDGKTEEKKDTDEFQDFETEEERAKQQELDKARAESKNDSGITAVANSLYIATIAHPCNGHPLSSAKYSRFQGLTDFIFFTAQESGSYSAYNAGSGMVVLGKYQFSDFGAQGNGTATALVSYMNANCSAGAAGLYSALYQAFVVEKRNAVNEWNACATGDTENFMAMQDEFAYEHYYLRGEAAVEAAGISLKDRPWVVKGMCFSIFNALGPYNEYGSGAYAITTAGIKNDDSNAVFIEKICDNMASLYADQYTWMYGRFVDGSDTALGVSDRDLALEILSGSLFMEPEPVTDTMCKVTVKDTTPKSAKKAGVTVQTIRVTGKTVHEYTMETENKELVVSEDYTVTSSIDEKTRKLNVTVSGKGDYEGQKLIGQGTVSLTRKTTVQSDTSSR